MLKKVLCGTMAIGLAALLGLPELAVASPHKAKQTSIEQNQLELAHARRRSKKSRRGRRIRPRAEFQQQPVHQVPQYLA